MSQTVVEEESLRFVFIAPCAEEEFFGPVKQGMQDASVKLGVESVFTGTEDVDLDQAELSGLSEAFQTQPPLRSDPRATSCSSFWPVMFSTAGFWLPH